MERFLSLGAGVGYATIFGFSFLVTKDALAVLDPIELIFVRFLIAALIMTLLVATKLIRVSFKGKPLGSLLLTCLFQPVLYFIFETYGVRESATSTAGIILGALPAIVAFLGVVVLKERTTTAQTAGLALSILGVVVVVLAGGRGSEGSGTARGALFLFGSMMSAALFNVLSRKASKRFTDFERTFAMMWSGAIIYGLIVGLRALVSDTGDISTLFARSAQVWYAFLYLGVLSSIIAFFLINYTLTRLKASQSAVFTNLVTVITVVAGVAIRKETFDIWQGFGALVIIAGVWFANRRGSEKAQAPSST